MYVKNEKYNKVEEKGRLTRIITCYYIAYEVYYNVHYALGR